MAHLSLESRLAGERSHGSTHGYRCPGFESLPGQLVNLGEPRESIFLPQIGVSQSLPRLVARVEKDIIMCVPRSLEGARSALTVRGYFS